MFVRFLVVVLLATVALSVVVHSSSGSGRTGTYVVRPADTLWTIAASHYGGDPREGVWKLQRANGLGGTAVIRPGQRLVLPR
jgi:nucleoid-associated protein YgaU